MRSPRPCLGLAAGLAMLALSACGPGEEPVQDAAPEETADTAAAGVDSAGLATDSGAADPATEDSGGGGEPFFGFRLDAEPEAATESRRLALRLVNPGERLAVVYADGGAGEVLLDSVPAASESRIDVLTRAPRVGLRSVASDGAPLRSTEIEVGPDTVRSVLVGDATPSR